MGLDIEVQKNDWRPWEEKWLLILHNLRRLRAIYEGHVRGAGNLDAESAANYLLIECHHLKDWLKADLERLPGVKTEQEIEDHFWQSDPLKVAEAVSNSHKHHTRDRRCAVTARVRATTTDTDANTCRVTYEVKWGEPDAHHKDARQLGEECVAAWRQFFTTHGVKPPGPA